MVAGAWRCLWISQDEATRREARGEAVGTRLVCWAMVGEKQKGDRETARSGKGERALCSSFTLNS